MGTGDETDPYGILDGLDFVETWNQQTHRDVTTVEEALDVAEEAPSSTPRSEQKRCPNCGGVRVSPKTRKMASQPQTHPEQYSCDTCGEHFDTPMKPDEIDISDRDVPFEWIDTDELAEPDDRGFAPALAGYDDETLTEIVLRVYRPWGDGGPSYRTLAEILPYSATWVGYQVRAWKDGEYRELVEDPTADPTPSVDAESATAVATDGGRQRRWAAYGSD